MLELTQELALPMWFLLFRSKTLRWRNVSLLPSRWENKLTNVSLFQSISTKQPQHVRIECNWKIFARGSSKDCEWISRNPPIVGPILGRPGFIQRLEPR